MLLVTKIHRPFIYLLPFFFLYCKGQQEKITIYTQEDIDPGFAENYAIPGHIVSQDTSPGWNQSGQKLLITGTVFKSDGKTVAPGIVIYYYHTNVNGRYIHKNNEMRSLPPNKYGQTHGYIRGWVKTDVHGNYSIYTVRPGTYPSRVEPAHIHLTVKEPALKKSYYLDDVVFDDDPLLTSIRRKKMENRGGSGVVRLVQKGTLPIGERNIILGLHIPGYTNRLTNSVCSGKDIGEEVISFTPDHAWGPDKGTSTCPICKYGWYHGILYCVGNHPDWNEIKQWLVFLERESKKRAKYLKVYFIYGNEKAYNKPKRILELKKIGEELQLENVALTFVPSFTDSESEIDSNQINAETENTFILYKRSKIIDKFINLKPNQANFDLIINSLNQSKNVYFDLPQPTYR
jgi:protocatechuate 3,4-dioxygenase, beta subunit